tara:strand:+ start:62 stop:175 length:114 start_codon:yes stop_codon:yes gene_type:complete
VVAVVEEELIEVPVVVAEVLEDQMELHQVVMQQVVHQ